jgi:hypothetical protein
MLNRVRPESARVADEIDHLGRKLRHVAEIFEQEDNTAARNLEGMGWVDFGVPAAGSGAITGAKAAFESINNNDELVKNWEDLKTKLDILKDAGEITFEQFKAWMNSIGIVDDYVIEVFYYQDDAVEILSISEEWTQRIVKTPIPVDSGWTAFSKSFKDNLGLGSSKLPLIGLAVDMGFTTWKYSDEGLFNNPKFYADLTTDGLMFLGGAAVMAGVAAIGLAGAPAVIATVAASVGWACVSNWLEEPLTEAITPGFEWAGEQLDGVWNGTRDIASDVVEWSSDAADWTANAVDEAADWVSEKGGNPGSSLIPDWSW